MRISLVTPSYNQGAFIERTINSVLEQRGDFELEYIIRDGGSTDNTLEILRSFNPHPARMCLTSIVQSTSGADSQQLESDTYFPHWISEPDAGQVDAINDGLRQATGEIVGWLNSDDILLPGALERVADCFSQNPSCLWLHSGCRIIDREDREIRKWISAYKRFCSRRYSRASLLSGNFISQMTVFWRRSLMDEVGYLDPQWPLAFDYDYWLLLAKLSDPFYIDAPLAAFRWHSASKSGTHFKQQCSEDEAIARRHGAKGLRWAVSKRLQNTARIAAYNLMSLTERLASHRGR